jgi:hypothetical protein
MTISLATIERFKNFSLGAAPSNLVRERVNKDSLAGRTHYLRNTKSRRKSTGNIARVNMNVYLRRRPSRLFSSSQVVLQKSLLIGIGVAQIRQCLCFTITGADSF